MGACSIVIQRLRRRFDHLFPINPVSSFCSSLRSRPAQPKEWNFFNVYKYHRAVRSFCNGSIKPALLAEKGSIQKHIRSSRFSFNFVKIHHGSSAYVFPEKLEGFHVMGYCNTHTSHQLSTTHNNVVENIDMRVRSGDPNGTQKTKPKKLKGKRAVVRWLKFFRWKKKKEYERMTSEEKILFNLKKARKKEEHLIEAMKKNEPKDSSVTTHDPEMLTPEEHFYLLKLGQKCKNYVPVGRRGIFQGVILNMHLHWKKHQTVKVIVKTFTTGEVREIAAELARLTGGIVLDIDEDNTIIMYRGKNYSQPPTEIMSPKVTLTRKKALDMSKYRDALHAVRRYIPKLEQDFKDLRAETRSAKESNFEATNREAKAVGIKSKFSGLGLGSFEEFGEIEDQISDHKDNDRGSKIVDRDDSSSSILSDVENLSDIFESDSDVGMEDKDARPLYLDEIERLPSEGDHGGPEDFQEHLRQISAAARRGELEEKDLSVAELDDIDKIFLSARSLLKKRRNH